MFLQPGSGFREESTGAMAPLLATLRNTKTHCIDIKNN